MLTKINLGCGPLPLYKQDLKYMEGDIAEWILADKYPENQEVMELDMENLSQFPDNHFTHIFASHSLEHIFHRRVQEMIKHWYTKMAPEGKLTINVPDLMWCMKQIERFESYQIPEGIYTEYFGHYGLLNIIYGSQTQQGEVHYCGFTKRSLTELLEEAGFQDVHIDQIYDDHKMGVLIATCKK